MTNNDTCVYTHTRSDGIVFYVGIGNKHRPYSEKGRNQHWRRTADKYSYKIQILHENLSWESACKIEIELIKKYKQVYGDKLCNVTEGGEGAKGLKHSLETKEKLRVARAKQSPTMLGKNHSEESKLRMSSSAKNKPPMSEETKAKMGTSKLGNTYMVGRKLSEETKAKLSIIAKNMSEETRAKIGFASKNRSDETREKMKLALKNPSKETREKISEALRNRPPMSDETKAKMSDSAKGKVFSEGHRAKLSAAKQGRTHSEETREKMRVSHKTRHLKILPMVTATTQGFLENDAS